MSDTTMLAVHENLFTQRKRSAVTLFASLFPHGKNELR
jgi:hypothetical protein